MLRFDTHKNTSYFSSFYTLFTPLVTFLFLNLGIQKMNLYVLFIAKEF